MRAQTIIVLVAALFLTGCVDPLPRAAADGPGAPSLSCAATPCVRTALGGFQSEPWVAVSPLDARNAIVATFGSTGGWGSSAYVSTTHDGGLTWHAQALPPVEGNPLQPVDDARAFPVRSYPTYFVDVRPVAADPMTAFTADGQALVVALVGRNVYAGVEAGPVFRDAAARPSDVVLWRSADGGATWSTGRVIEPSQGAVAFTPAGKAAANAWHDKPFLAVDPVRGTIHLFYDDVGETSTQLVLARSDDGGATWSKPQQVGSSLYGASAAAYDGKLLVTARNPGYQVLASEDGGATWTARGKAGDWPGPSSTWQAAPVALWANGTRVDAVLARAEGAHGERVVVQRSGDLGATWSAPEVVLPTVASDKRNPVLALDPVTGNGFVAAYQGKPGDAASLETWVAPLRIGQPQPPFRVSEGTARADSVFEYMGGAASAAGGIVAFASPGDAGSPLLAAPMTWT